MDSKGKNSTGGSVGWTGDFLGLDSLNVCFSPPLEYAYVRKRRERGCVFCSGDVSDIVALGDNVSDAGGVGATIANEHSTPRFSQLVQIGFFSSHCERSSLSSASAINVIQDFRRGKQNIARRMFNMIDTKRKAPRSSQVNTRRKALYSLTLIRLFLQFTQPSLDFRCVCRDLKGLPPVRSISCVRQRMVVFVPFNAIQRLQPADNLNASIQGL